MAGKVLAVLAKPCIIWPVGQAVKTRPFHGCNMGSIPVRVTLGEPGEHRNVRLVPSLFRVLNRPGEQASIVMVGNVFVLLCSMPQ